MGTLRQEVIKLATENPELRKPLLPLLKKTAKERFYNIVFDDAGTIAKEVINDHQSRGWQSTDKRQRKVATIIEKHLADFNIGFDDKTGEWVHMKGGSKFWQTHD